MKMKIDLDAPQVGDDVIVLILDERVRQEAGSFISMTHCPIATAIKRQVNDVSHDCDSDALIVGPNRVYFKDCSYRILGENGCHVFVQHAMDAGRSLCVVLRKVGT